MGHELDSALPASAAAMCARVDAEDPDSSRRILAAIELVTPENALTNA